MYTYVYIPNACIMYIIIALYFILINRSRICAVTVCFTVCVLFVVCPQSSAVRTCRAVVCGFRKHILELGPLEPYSSTLLLCYFYANLLRDVKPDESSYS